MSAPWPPRSIAHLKQHAKALKRIEGITHSNALELTAQSAGYRDYHEALQRLPKGGVR